MTPATQIPTNYGSQLPALYFQGTQGGPGSGSAGGGKKHGKKTKKKAAKPKK